MYLITGGMGFIGSNIVRKLNEFGITDIIVVDHAGSTDKYRNLSDCVICDYYERDDFSRLIEKGAFDLPLKAVFHQGACAVTTELDGSYMIRNNFSFSKSLLSFAVRRKIPFVYASSAAVYGTSCSFKDNSRANERPVNVYGYSKLLFDQYVRHLIPHVETPVIGLRYFNVYGPGEFHKGDMASMVYQSFLQLSSSGYISLFQGSGGYSNGEQVRDFIHVDDVVGVNLFFALENPSIGIFNLGTGKGRTFNDMARNWIDCLGKGEIRYREMPEAIRQRYQSFTEADLGSLRRAGYDKPFLSLKDGISRYHDYLTKNQVRRDN